MVDNSAIELLGKEVKEGAQLISKTLIACTAYVTFAMLSKQAHHLLGEKTVENLARLITRQAEKE